MYKQTSIILTIDRPTIETASNSRISVLKKISRNRLFSAGHTFYTLGSLREYENTGLSTNVRFDSTTRRVKEAFVSITAEIKKCALWHLRESRRRSVNLKSLFYTHCAHTAITRNRVYANDASNAINFRLKHSLKYSSQLSNRRYRIYAIPDPRYNGTNTNI